VSECFFCYQLTRVDLDKGPLNGLLLLLFLQITCLVDIMECVNYQHVATKANHHIKYNVGVTWQ